MSLTWMVVFTAVIAAQKLLPWRTPTIAISAVLLLALGSGLTFCPAQIPGLTVPPGALAMRAMS